MMPAKRDIDLFTGFKVKSLTKNIFISLLENMCTGH
jgi:hypothetical protein